MGDINKVEVFEGEVVKFKKADEVTGGRSFGFIKRTGEGVSESEKALFFSEADLAPGTTMADLVATDTNAKVTFLISDSEKGPSATNVSVISKSKD